MFSYLQMPFLQALGYAIANSIWQVFLLWLIALLVNSIARQSSHIKYVTALSAQIAGFVWFLTTFQFYYRHCLAASAQAEQMANGNAAMYLPDIIAGENNILSVLVRAEETLPFLSLAYLFLLAYLTAKWVQNFRFTKVLSDNGLQSIDDKWQTFVNEMSDRLNVMQDVKIYLSAIAKSPLTIGYIKPIILLPLASINHLTAEQLEAVILHELAHIKRADYIINLLISVAEMILFFNPFTRLLSRAIQKEREHCCDDWVLQYQYSPGMYAEALLLIACLQQEGFQMSAAAQPKGDLLQRVKRMVQPSEKKFSYRHQATAMMVIAGLLFCIAWLQPDETNYHRISFSGNHTEDKKIVIAPMMAQVDNPFFNGASLLTPSLHEDMLQSLSELDKIIADSDNVTNRVKEAQTALEKVTPIMTTTMSSGNWQRIVKEVTKSASRSLHSMNVQLPDIDTSHFIDSDYLVQTINAALSKTNQMKVAQAGLDAAKKELENLQQSKAFNDITFSTDYLNQLGVNALASLQNLHFDIRQDSIIASFDKIKKIEFEQSKKAQEKIEKQAKLLQQIQERKIKILALLDKRKRMPAEPFAPQMPEEIDEATDNADTYVATDATQPVAYSWSNSEPFVHPNDLQTKTTKTIHITRSGDSGIIHIVIEIRQ